MPKTLASTSLRTVLAAVLLLLAAGTARADATAVEPALGSGCGAPQLAGTPLFTAAPEVAPSADGETPLFVEAMAFCEATCSSGSKISCSGSTCSAKDDPDGYVVCDGDYTYCPRPACSPEGATRWVDRGCCCNFSVPRQRSVEQRCVGGQWQDTGQSGCAGQCSSGGCLEP